MGRQKGGGSIGYRLIEDYALIGDTHSAGLVSRAGSIDWLCLPRFDSGSCFAALLDAERGGHWSVAPAGKISSIERSYRHESMVLETTFTTAEGRVRLVDCLAVEEGTDFLQGSHVRDLILRLVEGVEGTVPMTMVYRPRFDYGNVVPWLREHESAIEAVGGPDALDLRAGVPLVRDHDHQQVTAEWDMVEGDSVSFIASHHPSHQGFDLPAIPDDCHELIERTDAYWHRWAEACSYDGDKRDLVVRSLLTLKALTYSPTGGLVAAATTSLPEHIGGVRNWDYRYCWLRDATFSLEVLLEQGFLDEATAWRDWLLRAVAGDPQDLQIMYGVRGERRLPEYELAWLEGYEGSAPVRVGNRAVEQFQLDVYGEVLDSFHTARRAGVPSSEDGWRLESAIVDHVCKQWQEPDEGIWEIRSGREHFVHSKVMAWVAVDRAIAAVENFGKDGPLEHWKEVRAAIREDILAKGIDADRGCFTRAYGDPGMDAALLALPLVGFIEASDPVMVATIDEVAAELMHEGFLRRYITHEQRDGLPPGEGVFLLCSFWLADCYVLLGRDDEARALFERLVGLANDVGLLSEQFDPDSGRLVGNFPQAFSHVALVTTAMALETGGRVRSAL